MSKDHDYLNAGMFFMVGVAGTSLAAHEKKFLQQTQPKGVIYFRRNIESPNQIISLNREIQKCVDHPLIIGIDQEGGPVARLQKPFTTFPANEMLAKAYAQDGDLDRIEKKARYMARELKAVGINCNFTPVADIMTNPDNPVMKARTFGQDPEVVSTLVRATIQTYMKQGVICCAKHFPGHGDTQVDSHLELPFVDTDRTTLHNRELVPFAAAIKAKVPMIMTAHIRYTSIDKSPATLSPYFLTTLLRKKMGYQGCIVSDDLEMKAIEHNYDLGLASVDALRAGCNLLLVCEDQDKARYCMEHVAKKLKTKALATRLQENRALYRTWHKGYLKKRNVSKRAAWGWSRHQNTSWV